MTNTPDWMRLKPPGRHIRMNRGFLALSVKTGLPFVMDSLVKDNPPPKMKAQKVWAFGVDDRGSFDRYRLNHVGSQVPVLIVDIYYKMTGNTSIGEDDMMPFPYDPTGDHPWMVGDVFKNRAGHKYRVIGYVYDAESGQVNVRYRGPLSESNTTQQSEKDPKYSLRDLQYFHLLERPVVDWETYLVQMLRWAVPSPEKKIVTYDEGVFALHMIDDGAPRTPEAIRWAHERTAGNLKHRPAVGIKILEDYWSNGAPPEPHNFWRLYARGHARDRLYDVRRDYEDSHKLEAPYQIKSTLHTKRTATPTHQKADLIRLGKLYESSADIIDRLDRAQGETDEPEDELFAHLDSL